MINDEIGGHVCGGGHVVVAPERREASKPLPTGIPLPPAAPIPEIAGQDVRESHVRLAGAERGATQPMQTISGMPLAPSISALRELQRQRRFCIVSQSRCDRSCEAFIARYLGYSPDQDETARKEVWKRASAIRREVEGSGGEGQIRADNHASHALSACAPIILNSAAARLSWDQHRKHVEKEMRRLARSLPLWAWAYGIAGFGDLGVAIIVAETGDLSGYATKERVWKRLGLAVIAGERQQRKTGAEAAAAHGYSPQRRAEVWTIGDSLFRHQWRGAKDMDGKDAAKTGKPVAVPAHPLGPYGKVYGRRKEHTASINDVGGYAERAQAIVERMRREGKAPQAENVAGRLTRKHLDNDARRVMTKALVEAVWRVWNGKAALAGKEGPHA